METALTPETAGLGIPVEIGRIDKELGRLWESSADTKSRASLINFVIHSSDPSSLAADTALISAVAARHACRAILILSNPSAPVSSARAWINAHCHPPGKSGREICSEQITFLLDGENASALPNIVFSHLDSDLPLCLWWKSELPEPIDEKLWAWVDRLIYDSAEWAEPSRQFAIVRHLSARDGNGAVLCDLNWTRLHMWRHALAALFDHASAFPCLSKVEAVEIEAAPGSRTAALLLLGWFANRLDWSIDPIDAVIRSPDGLPISFELRGNGGPDLSNVTIRCNGALFEIKLAPGAEFFEALIHAPGIPDTKQLLPAPTGKLADTLLAELSRAGRHPLYTKSLEKIHPLLIPNHQFLSAISA
jgi:glucose-6-phosphate dehydrogenase assembly protein OpcA